MPDQDSSHDTPASVPAPALAPEREPLGWRPIVPFVLALLWAALFLAVIALVWGAWRRVPTRAAGLLAVAFVVPPIVWMILARRAAPPKDGPGRLYLRNHFRNWWCTRGVVVGCAMLALGALVLLGPLWSAWLARTVGGLIDAIGLAVFIPVFLLGPLLIYAGVRGRSRGAAPHCGVCGYPCPNTRDGGVCPECGQEVRRKWAVWKGEHARGAGAIAIGAALLLGAFVGPALSLVGAGRVFVRSASDAALVELIGRDWAFAGRRDVWAEVLRRGPVAPTLRDAAVGRTCDAMGAFETGEPGMGAWVAGQVRAGGVRDATLIRVAYAAFAPSGTAEEVALAESLLSGPLDPKMERAVFAGIVRGLRNGSLTVWRTCGDAWWADRLGSDSLSKEDETALVEAGRAASASARVSLRGAAEAAIVAHPTPRVVERALRIWSAMYLANPRETLGSTPSGPLGDAVCVALLEGRLPSEAQHAAIEDEALLSRAAAFVAKDLAMPDGVARKIEQALIGRLKRGEPLAETPPDAWRWLRSRRRAKRLSADDAALVDQNIEVVRAQGPGAD